MNLLESEPKKGKGKKKKKQKQMANDIPESFFKFFSNKDELHGNPDEDDLDDADEERLGMIEDDFSIAMEFRDEIIPLALEYYLNIVEEHDEGEGEDIEDHDAKPDGETVGDGKIVADPKDENSDHSLDD